MIHIEEGHVLYQLKEFQLVKSPDKAMKILVYETMSGKTPHKFLAVPVLPLEVKIVREEIRGEGSTEEEALQNCIDKIMNVDKDTVFKKPL